MTNSAKTSFGIPKGWKKIPMSNLGFFIGGVSSLKREDYGFGTPFITYKNIYSHSRVNINELALMNVKAQELVKRNCIYGDIFFTASSETMDEVAISSVLLDEVENLTFNGFCKRYRLHNFNEILPEYLRYYLRSRDFRIAVYEMVTGDTRFNISQASLSQLNITKPPLHEQKSIAHILGTLDDKIELNRQMNKTLEAMVHALFKDWFVNFAPTRAKMSNGSPYFAREIWDLFPNKLDDEGKPQGWEMSTIGEQVNRLTVQNRYKKNNVFTYGKVPVFEQGANILMGYHNEIPDVESSLEQPKFIFGDHTCVIKLSAESFSVANNVIVLDGKNHNTYWVYYAIQGKQSFEEYRRHWMEFIAKPLLLPSRKLTDAFSKIVQHNIEKSESIKRETLTLCQIRDMLLPKLISGKVRTS